MNQLKLIHVPFLIAASLLASDLRPISAQDAQVEFPQASPASFVRDKFGLTTVEIEYARPGVKDRKIFGGLVAYGEVWRTGANAATKITFDTEVSFGGEKVPAGTYALFTIPGEAEWTFILNRVAGQWGSYNYDASNDLVRVKAKPVALGAPQETLSIGLTHLRSDSAHLTLAWEKTRVSVPLKTDLVAILVPRIEAAMATEGGNKPYLQAAMFYYEHDLDLKKALSWIDQGLEAQPDAVWIVYRRGLILAKAGDKDGAYAAAERTVELAMKTGGALGAEYARLGEDLIASLD